MARKIATALRQQVLSSGSYLERKLSAVETDGRAVHRATAAAIRSHGSNEAQVMLELFHSYNETYFSSKLAAPLVLILSPTSARALGDYCPRDAHGLESRIRIAPRVLKKGSLFAFDVLLHEMIHAFAQEVLGDLEPGYRGHGPKFAAVCNAIGDTMGLPHVAAKGRDGLADCAHWPLNVRPAGYYPEPYEAPTRSKKAAASDESEPSDSDGNDSDAAEREKSASALRAMRARLDGELSDEELDALDHAIALLGC